MDRVVLIVGAVAVAGIVAWLVDRRKPAPPTAPTANVPGQLDRRDFARPDTPWLIVVFTAASCTTCAGVWESVRALEAPDIAVQELELGREAALHRRYAIDAVPTLLVADAEGVVVRWFLGPVAPADLHAALTDLRRAD